jgi:hypothetical protein
MFFSKGTGLITLPPPLGARGGFSFATRNPAGPGYTYSTLHSQHAQAEFTVT